MTFTWWGDELEVFDAPYNSTAFNERGVEIAVALSWMADRVLVDGIEVGAVLQHYGFPTHRVVDKYEQGPGVENIDVMDIDGQYDWVLSISTIEHVGWDELQQDARGAIKALDHLVGLLARGGAALITVPGGYNPALDDYLATGAGASRACTMVRSTEGWVQSDELLFLRYGSSTPWAESVFIGEWGGER